MILSDVRSALRRLVPARARWTGVVAAVFIGTMTVTGCEDSSDVGVGLVGEEAPPRAFTLEGRDVEPTTFAPVSGNRRRVLVGRVSDPLFGDVMAKGYVDFTSPTEKPDAFTDGDNDVSEATLHLWGRYAYGDTTEAVELTLRSMPESWEATGRRSDTTLTAGSVITTQTISPGADSVSITLPDSWIDDHEALLQGATADFNTGFHGFALTAENGRLVRGFHPDSSRLSVTVEETTLPFEMAGELVTTERIGEPTLPEGRTYLQGGSGPALSLRFDLDADSLARSVLNRFVLTVPVDRTTMQEQSPSGFQRPFPEQLSLFAVQPDGNQVHLETGEPTDDGTKFVFDSASLASQLQGVLLGEREVDHFLVAGSASAAIDLSGVLVRRAAAGKSTGPRARLTIVPTQN